MTYTRRQFGTLALAALPSMKWLGDPRWVTDAGRQTAKPNSNFGGVHVGAVSYSFRQISYSPEDVLKGMFFLGLNVLELEQSFFEHYLGAPPDPTGGGQPAGAGRVPAGGPFGVRSPNAPPPDQVPSTGLGAPGRVPNAGIGREGAQAGSAGGPITPEQQVQEQKIRAELKQWRMSAPWDKVRALRKMYDDVGVEIRIVKFPQLGGKEMTDEEVEYCFQFAKTIGARAITCEPPLPQAKRVAHFADKHQIMVGYHAHSSRSVDAFGRPGAWEQAFFYSKYNSANVDLGHFVAGNNFPPTDFIKEYHDRITNIHLKDRKLGTNGGANVPWGQGDTPLKETLQLMKREKYTFPAMIELEYQIPERSSVMDEMVKCVQYCKDALA